MFARDGFLRDSTSLVFTSHKQMIITQSSTKAEIIDASCEVIDTQQEKISELQERQLVLWVIVGVLVVLLAFGA